MKPKSPWILPFLLFGLFSCGGASTASVESSVSPEVSSESPERSSSQSELSSEEPISSTVSSSTIEESSSSTIDPATLYDGYYASLVSWENGEDLKNQLHDIISGGTYRPIVYAGSKTNWASNIAADQDLYDYAFVDGIYSTEPILKSGTQTKWQREHAFCASLMTGSLTGSAVNCLGRATDFHNLFASSTNGNTSRGNKNYGIADKSALGYTDRTSNNGFDGYSYDEKTFEPGDKDKGRLARAIFYMATMYSEDTYDEKNQITMKALKVVEDPVDFVAGNDCKFAIGNLSALLEWATLPVDLLEYRHNESVYSYVPELHSDPANNVAQGNRNPFVDFPGLVDCVYGSKKGEPGQLKDYISSYEALDIAEESVRYYAIEDAKRNYDEDAVFHKEDIHVVSVSHSFVEEPFTDFEVEGAIDGEAFQEGGIQKITVKTPLNSITYEVNVATDPIDSATWKHKVTGKTGDGDFSTDYNKAGAYNVHTFDDVAWKVLWQEGEVAGNDAKGAKFGANANSPVKKIIFETVEPFAFKGASNVEAIYLSGAASSGKSYDVTFSLNGTALATTKLGYVDSKTPLLIGTAVEPSAPGIIKIEITNITAACYVNYLAVHAS